ncbi:MAG TPA: lactate racemase domain-containing protein [Gaiellaceae bacterium]|nr:lactate racemase domain-containing protein [Gaiellaceae bacterium]
MTRIPLLAGRRIVVVDTPRGASILRPPPPTDVIREVAAATGEALRFPLSGPPLASLVTPGGSATVLVEPLNLPIPSAVPDPRQEAVAATVEELGRLGVANVTILVAGGLHRRLSPREIGLLVPPEFRRRFRGRLIVHDAESEELVEVGVASGIRLRVARALVETELVVTVTAAESVLHGGPCALLRAGSAELLRAAGATSLLEPSSSQGWSLGVELERLLAARVGIFGVSLVLNLPHVFGGYPYDEQSLERISRSRLRRTLGVLPAAVRGSLIERVPRELTAATVLGGRPSVAHSEALLRAIEFKGATLEEPLDAIVVGIPPTTPFLPRALPNPVSAAYLGLGLALRLWRNAFPVRPGGTAILLHDFSRRFPAPVQSPYRSLFADSRTARDPDALREAERAALADERAIAEYRAGHSVHPLEPFSSWSACDAALSRLGPVLVAGCRDAASARQLGFVPVHNVNAALTMARGRGAERIGFLLSPPYFPLVVESDGG